LRKESLEEDLSKMSVPEKWGRSSLRRKKKYVHD